MAEAAQAELEAEEGHRTRLCYDADEDRFYLVAPDGALALALPRDVNAHMQELVHPEEKRLHCYQGFVAWPR